MLKLHKKIILFFNANNNKVNENIYYITVQTFTYN